MEKQHVKRLGPRVQNQKEEKEVARDERITIMEHQKVLNGRAFDPDIVTELGIATMYDVVLVQEWIHLFETPPSYMHEAEVHEFFYKMELLEDGGLTTTVKEIRMHLDKVTLWNYFGSACTGS